MAAFVIAGIRKFSGLLSCRSFSQAMESQITNRVMLIKPTCFNYNPQTAESNKFQKKIDMAENSLQSKALQEFSTLAAKLKELDISVKIFEDDIKESSDAVFPNNWISFHSENKMAVYPMLSEARRRERNPAITQYWAEALGSTIVDYSHHEKERKYLEGTGSMVLDRPNKIAFACLSPRTSSDVLNQFCADFGYKPITFRSLLSPQPGGEVQECYHTNVVMAMGCGFAVVCLESVTCVKERASIERSLSENNIEVIPITVEQVREFAGNVLQLKGLDGRSHLIMSTRAHSSFTRDQLSVLQRHTDTIAAIPLDVIERVGGGGVRCMIAEIFPPIENK